MKKDKYDIKVREWEHSGKSVKAFNTIIKPIKNAMPSYCAVNFNL